MKKKVISVLSILCFLTISINVSAQSSGIKKLLDNPKKMYGKTFVYGRLGDSKYIRKWQIKKGYATEADYVLPKKVGILTFIVHDKSSSSSYTAGGWKHSTTSKATKDGVSMLANQIYFNVIKGMKESFSHKGMNLLEPSEYLDTDTKRDLYNNYKLKNPKILKLFSGITGSGNSGPAIGYRAMPLVSFGLTASTSTSKAGKARDAFFNQLGLDAILTVEIVMSITGDAVFSIQSNILYKNPASGSKTYYGDYSESISVKISSNQYAKKPEYRDIFVFKKVEYKNKKGKTKTRNEAVGLDPNLYKLVNAVVGANVGSLEKFVLGKK
ncbi:MAG: hypothetical protein QM486_11660 [Flavobacteriaceae bacterium]